MSVNIDKLIRLNDLATLASRRKRIIILDPKEKDNENFLSEDVYLDKVEWKMPEEIEKIVKDLSQNSRIKQ